VIEAMQIKTAVRAVPMEETTVVSIVQDIVLGN
jgi:hypothetical protein